MHVEYMQLAGILGARIERGDWAPGSRMPSEQDIGDHYELSRKTVRRAMRVLADRGLVVSIRGRGHFITETLGQPSEEA